MNTKRTLWKLAMRIVAAPSWNRYYGIHYSVALMGNCGTTIYEEIATNRDKAISRADDFNQALGGGFSVVVR